MFGSLTRSTEGTGSRMTKWRGQVFRQLSFASWLWVGVRRRLNLVCMIEGKLLPTTGAFMPGMDQIHAPVLGWCWATIFCRRRGFAISAVRCEVPMAFIVLATHPTQGATLQYVTLRLSEKASFIAQLAFAVYYETWNFSCIVIS